MKQFNIIIQAAKARIINTVCIVKKTQNKSLKKRYKKEYDKHDNRRARDDEQCALCCCHCLVLLCI